jgi:hypothetical protein
MKAFKVICGLAVAGMIAVCANAVPIYLPPITTGQPADPGFELDRLNDNIALYNNLADIPDLPLAVAVAPEGNREDGAGGTSITIDFSVNPANYLLLKWDGRNEFWFVGNEMASWTFENTRVLNRNDRPEGLSHWALFDPKTTVPDGGLTVGLLGMAIAAMGFVGRKIK